MTAMVTGNILFRLVDWLPMAMTITTNQGCVAGVGAGAAGRFCSESSRSQSRQSGAARAREEIWFKQKLRT